MMFMSSMMIVYYCRSICPYVIYELRMHWKETKAYPSFAKEETIYNVLDVLKIDKASPQLSFGKAIFNEFKANCTSLLTSARKRKSSIRYLN